MRLPRSIRIGPLDFKIVKLGEQEAKQVYGFLSSDKQTLGLAPTFASDAQMADTVLHEVLHGIFHTSNIKGRDGEERVVSALATGLIQVFRDNPKFLKWLAHKTQDIQAA